MDNKYGKTFNNNKGQALVEFVLILPIFLLLLFAIYDFGIIFTRKTSLENSSSDIINLYKNGKTIDEIRSVYNNLKIEISEDGDYKNINISDDIKIITPGLNLLFGNPYEINVERYIINEQ